MENRTLPTRPSCSGRKLTPLEHYLADLLFYWMPEPTYGKAIEEAVEWAAPSVKRILQEYPDEKMTRNQYDIPTEVVLPYIVRERDKALRKVETLTGYAKGLEARIQEMERDAARLKQQLLEMIAQRDNLAKKLTKQPTERQKKAARRFLKQAEEALAQFERMEVLL